MDDLTIYSSEELQEIQRLETEALKVIISICEILKIEYFLIGGTALGAVRHGGFIPWDDDIDIGMTRANYKRFMLEAPALLPEKYHLQTTYGDYTTPYYYSKVRIDGTKFVEYCNHRVKMHQGVYVDIFPFDNVPDDENDYYKQFKTIRNLIRVFAFRQSPDVYMKPVTLRGKVKACVRVMMHRICKMIIPRKLLFAYLDKEFTKYNNTETKALACLNFPKWKTDYILKSDLYPLEKHMFGDINANIPRNSHQYLITHYGDYMKLPPEDKRYGHKPYYVNLHSDE